MKYLTIHTLVCYHVYNSVTMTIASGLLRTYSIDMCTTVVSKFLRVTLSKGQSNLRVYNRRTIRLEITPLPEQSDRLGPPKNREHSVLI